MTTYEPVFCRKQVPTTGQRNGFLYWLLALSCFANRSGKLNWKRGLGGYRTGPAAQAVQLFPDNRVKMGYLGPNGQAGPALDWIFRLSYSRKYGTYSSPYPVAYGQCSALVGVQWLLPRIANTLLTASLAMDLGQLVPNTVGGFIGLRRKW